MMDDNEINDLFQSSAEINNKSQETLSDDNIVSDDLKLDVSDEKDINYNTIELLKNYADIFPKANNVAYNITINNISGDNVSDGSQKNSFGENNLYDDIYINNSNKKEEQINIKSSSSSVNLADYEQLYDYLKNNQDSPYCAFLIALSIFDNCQFDLICNEAEILYKMMIDGENRKINNEGEILFIEYKRFDVSRKEICSNFDVKFYRDYLITYGGKITTDFVGFSIDTYSSNVLRCIFSEFIDLRKRVTGYLNKLISSEKLTLYVSAINAIKKICDINSEFFISNVVNCLLKNNTIVSDIAAAEILCAIANSSDNIYSADKYLNIVHNKKNIHYYIVGLLICKLQKYKSDKISTLVRPILKELLIQPGIETYLHNINSSLPVDKDFINNIDLFYNIGGHYAEYYIALLAELCKLIKDMKKNDHINDFAHLIALFFVQEDLTESFFDLKKPEKFRDMVFIRLILRDKDTINNLVFLWTELLCNRQSSGIAKQILTEYLTCRDKYEVTEVEYKKIERFFVVLASQPCVRNNIIFLLKNLSTKPKNSVGIAKQIYKQLGGML